MCTQESCSAPIYTDIQNYTTKPVVDFYSVVNNVWERHRAPTGNDYQLETVKLLNGLIPIGIEIEAEHSDEEDIDDSVYEVIQEMHRYLPCDEGKSFDKWKQLVIAKSDGSLDDGVEFVSQPLTMTAHKAIGWEALQYKGFYAWNTSTCGIHMHVPKAFFTNKQLWLFLKLHQQFIHNNAELFAWITGRKSVSYSRWTMPAYDEFGIRNQLLAVACTRRTTDNNRYLFVNMLNPATIELRYFKGNINTEGILSRIEFVQAMYDFVVVASTMEIHLLEQLLKDLPQHFVQFVYANNDEYPIFGKKMLRTERWGANSGYVDLSVKCTEFLNAGKGR